MLTTMIGADCGRECKDFWISWFGMEASCSCFTVQFAQYLRGGTDGFCLFPSVPMGMFVGDGRRCFYTRLRTDAIFRNGARASSGIRILKSLRVHLKFR